MQISSVYMNTQSINTYYNADLWSLLTFWKYYHYSILINNQLTEGEKHTIMQLAPRCSAIELHVVDLMYW